MNQLIHFGFESIHLGLSYEDSILPQGLTEGSQHNSFYSRINITRWGSEYQTSLVFEIVKVVRTLNGKVSNGVWKPHQFSDVSTNLKLGPRFAEIWYSVSVNSSLDCHSKNLMHIMSVFNCFWNLGVWYSDPHCNLLSICICRNLLSLCM